MARTSKKTIYERIEIKKAEISKQEDYLNQLDIELQELYAEKDKQEQQILLEHMKANGLTLDKAIELLNVK